MPNPQEFVAKWRQSSLKERSSSQEHFIDLCRLLNHPTPAELDPVGERFTFEKGASKQRGGQGWADVWYKGHFAWEYKGKHADLDKAYQQLLQYREALENPPLLIVSDIDRILIHSNFTNTVKQIYEIGLDDLLTPEGLQTLRHAFYRPEALRTAPTTEQVTEEAARQFAQLAERLRKYGEDSQRIAHFLIRLLFCLFAEDIGLLPTDLFTRLIIRTRHRAPAFAGQLRQLFDAMASGGWFGEHEIAYFNGRLFDDTAVLELDSEGLDVILRVSGLDWASIEPSILGTLFERSLDPAKRAQLGAHYTSREDIMLIVEPVLMAPLRRRWQEVQAQAYELAAKRDEVKGGQRTRLHNELSTLLTGFAQEIARVRVLDAAAGSGNFLYVALRELLNLEKEVIILAGDLGVGRFFPSVSPAQLYGIEINDYAHELAQTTVWIGYIQWLHENGFGQPGEPILKPLDNIKRMDAILDHDDGNPTEPEWPEADVIIGNPPFLGSRKMRPTLGDNYCDALLQLYGGRIDGLPDLICFWFERTKKLIAEGKVKRAGLLATQAIRGGTNRQVLDRIKDRGDIFMAWSDREWILDGATVHVSIVGFDDGIEQHRVLDGIPVLTINSDLTADIDLANARQLVENANLSFQGVVLRGPFNITYEQAQEMLAASGNPNSRPNSDVIRPRRTGQDVTSHPSNEYVIDFGIDMSIEQASMYVMPFEYLKKNVYPMRQEAKQAAARQKWWLHWNARTTMRNVLADLYRYIATPRVAKHRIFVWLDASILPDAQLVVFARSDDYFFGVLHSKVHELWARRQGTQLRDATSGFRYTSTTTFETFPFPWPPGEEPTDDPRVDAIAHAARELVRMRDTWLHPPEAVEAKFRGRTLTNLYNERPTWLALAHAKLDSAVLDAYDWPNHLSDLQILERLLDLNLQRVSAQ